MRPDANFSLPGSIPLGPSRQRRRGRRQVRDATSAFHRPTEGGFREYQEDDASDAELAAAVRGNAYRAMYEELDGETVTLDLDD